MSKAKASVSIEETQELLVELRRQQVVAEQNMAHHSAEYKRYKQEVLSINTQISQAIDGRHQQSLPFKKAETTPVQPEPAKGNTYDVHQDGTVEVRPPQTTPVNGPGPAEPTTAPSPAPAAEAATQAATERKKPGRKPKPKPDDAAPAAAPPVPTQPEPTGPPPITDPKNPPRPQGSDWKALPLDGHLIGCRPNDIMALEDAGIKTLGQLASMSDSGLLAQSENISKAAADRATTALQNWFIQNS